MKNRDLNSRKPSSPWFAYFTVVNMLIRMVVVITGLTWGGHLLDDYLHNANPVFTLISLFLGFTTAIYILYRTLLKN